VLATGGGPTFNECFESITRALENKKIKDVKFTATMQYPVIPAPV
jgi:molybdenum cofactor biosynthesis enzyme MoaA